jgi:hypothetical protein
MPITWKSTGVRQRVIIDREPDGRQRVARATQSDYNGRHWNLEVEHPSGEKFVGTFTGGTADEASVALVQMLMDREHEFQEDKERGDRRRAEPFDRNRRVDEGGNSVAPELRGWTKS